MIERIIFLLCLIAAVAILVITAMDYTACKDAGGALVRGLFWFECVGGKP